MVFIVRVNTPLRSNPVGVLGNSQRKNFAPLKVNNHFARQHTHVSFIINGAYGVAGLPDFSWYNLPKRGKIYQTTTQYTKMSIIYQMAVKLTKCPKNTPTSFIARPSKMYPNWNFWSENKPSGDPLLWSFQFFKTFKNWKRFKQIIVPAQEHLHRF
jgi:hypothetical protein